MDDDYNNRFWKLVMWHKVATKLEPRRERLAWFAKKGFTYTYLRLTPRISANYFSPEKRQRQYWRLTRLKLLNGTLILLVLIKQPH